MKILATYKLPEKGGANKKNLLKDNFIVNREVSETNGILCELRAPMVMSEYHWHEHIEINIVHEGELTYELSGHSITFAKDSVIAFWATVPHRVSAVSSDALMTIISIPVDITFNWRLHNSFGARLLNGDIAKLHQQEVVHIAECRRWYKQYINNDPILQGIAREEIGLFLRRLSLNAELIVSEHIEVGRPERNISSNTAKHVHQMICYISSHFQEPITVEDVALAVRLNPKYAMSIFQNMLDMTIKNYITKMRIHRAKILLSQSQLSVSEIGLESGFRSTSAFYAAFQSKVDMKPLEYRKLKS